MNDSDFQRKLGELLGQIDHLPADQKEAMHTLAEETKDRHEKLRKTVKDLQDSLDYLRLSVKYLVFDLEATRRENAYLRKVLEQQSSGSDGSEQGGADSND
jgi:hypothetical protein